MVVFTIRMECVIELMPLLGAPGVIAAALKSFPGSPMPPRLRVRSGVTEAHQFCWRWGSV